MYVNIYIYVYILYIYIYMYICIYIIKSIAVITRVIAHSFHDYMTIYIERYIHYI